MDMSAKIRAAGVALAMAIRLSPVAAQEVPRSSSSQQLTVAKAVEVDVTGENGKGIPHVNVNLTSLDSQRGVKTAVTDSSGRVSFDGQLDGRYQLDISGPGNEDYPWVEDHGWVVFVTSLRRWFGLSLRVINGKAVEMHFEASDVIVCESCLDPSPIETEMLMSEDKLVPPPPLPVVSLVPPRAPRRNPVARFFSAIGHQLGF
jgi:hypothetical protein